MLKKNHKMEEFKFGDIIDGKRTNHPIIFFSIKNEDQFYGCIITHFGNYDNNFAPENKHFTEKDKNGETFKIQYENSFFAKLKLEKQNDWGPFLQVGSLSEEGKEFVKNKIQHEQAISWRKYIRSLKEV